MKQEIVFILDRSGSMAGSETDTIGGYNSFLSQQKEEEGEAQVTTVLFDHDYELLHDGADLCSVKPITAREYFVRGSTALLDAVGHTIERVRERAKKAIFVIITDGKENASRTYSYARVQAMISERRLAGWQFLFLGADLADFGDADRLGIDNRHRAVFAKDDMMALYESASLHVSGYRKGQEIDLGHLAGIRLEDIYRHRRLDSVESLYNNNGADVPQKSGLYFVVVPEGFAVEFTDDTTAIHEYKGQTMLYPSALLEKGFRQTDRKVLYIGKASGERNALRQRILQLVRYAYGEVENHRGGRALWQIRDNKNLLVGYIPCDDATTAEQSVLNEYRKQYRVLPLAMRAWSQPQKI